MPTDDRMNAEDELLAATEHSHPEHGIKHALAGIGYAVLDLASAIREQKGAN
jgi:hypothetical protein